MANQEHQMEGEARPLVSVKTPWCQLLLVPSNMNGLVWGPGSPICTHVGLWRANLTLTNTHLREQVVCRG